MPKKSTKRPAVSRPDTVDPKAKTPFTGTRADGRARRMAAEVNGDGDDALKPESTRHNQFFGKPTPSQKLDSNFTRLDGCAISPDDLRAISGKRIAHVKAGQYDVTISFTDGTVGMLMIGGEGLEMLVTAGNKKRLVT